MQEVWNGDSRDLAGKIDRPIDCIITDPPYGVAYRSRHATTPDGKKYVEDVKDDHDLDGAVQLFHDVMNELAHSPGGFAPETELYVFTRWDIVDTWMDAVRALSVHGFRYKMLLVWQKGTPGTGDIDCNWGCGHELILYAKRGKKELPYRRNGVIAVDMVPPSKIIHPTEKPVALLERLIEMSTKRGELVVDPFAGSLSTAAAAQNLGRDYVVIEQSAEFVRRGKQRLEQDTLF